MSYFPEVDVKMSRNMRNAYRALKKLGAPVFTNTDNIQHGNFKISAEDNVDRVWADYYCEFGINRDNRTPGVDKDICDIMERYDLYLEWENAGCLTAWPV